MSTFIKELEEFLISHGVEIVGYNDGRILISELKDGESPLNHDDIINNLKESVEIKKAYNWSDKKHGSLNA